MADLSIYLFWTGLAFAGMAVLLYIAFVGSASLSLRRYAAQTEAGTLTVTGATGAPNAGLGRLATTFTALTSLALVGAVAARWVAVEHPPFSNLYEFTVAFAMAIVVAYLGFEAASGLRRAGVVALPIVAIMLFIASRFPSDVTPLVPALQNAPLLTLHVTVIMASYAVLTVAFCGAAIYLVQGGEGHRRFAWLPGPDAAGDLAHRAVLVGFPLLGLGIALGAWWANDAWGRYWGWDPKETSALVTWLSIVAYFHARAGSGSVAGAPGIRKLVPARIRRGWRPDPMWWLVAMWALVMFTYFGVNLWVSGLHSYAGV
ncbi:MAG: cytochrome c biogenesis protein CcsA [Dehalococcoidia bacterium]|nr:MAG: c-type cytochrome biogenesis protein CcsB [bacterium]MCE7926940.1 c-type cytochrome biogenesis protein CcsB [Chloroflexi bacterium CFX7]MCK6563309.1 cytochrome c biogenesis protein CcsA [Dehalococcoidia bacterium]MCL4232154.1 cytochrome c biogenesis protein CcsA [Dehalococcoidia bacterium]NUQ55633.1 cytochrome c biogenesis protein CcsA [Dehalococcoidia bacterium]